MLPSVRAAEGVDPGGVHAEMTGDNVTECTGGACAISDEAFNDRYHTVCDPRLNAEQSIDIVFPSRTCSIEAPGHDDAVAGGRGVVADVLAGLRLVGPKSPAR